MSQFFLNGLIKNTITGGADRELDNSEKIFAGVSAGAASSVVAGPMELVMIQQQVKGGSLVATTSSLLTAGPKTVFRGTPAMMLREGLYCGGFLGFIPVTRQEIQKRYPEMSEDRARLSACFLAGPLCTLASHPPDTIKTCLQGDIEGKNFKGYGQGIKKLIAERGIQSLWAGMPWRMFRQFVCFVMIDKINSDLAPIIFPHAFK